MLGEYDDELLPYTPIDVAVPFVFAPGAALPSPFGGLLPPAHNGVGQLNTAGEYRGVYGKPGAWIWKTDWSRYKFVRPNGLPHWGVDIHAPVGTPLVSVVDGDLTFANQPSGLGLYAILSFEKNGARYAFHYGHMKDKRGAPRSVAKGEVLGWVGCSGNADINNVCSTSVTGQPFSSSHLHFALLPPQGANQPKRCDPVATLDWKVITPAKPADFP